MNRRTIASVLALLAATGTAADGGVADMEVKREGNRVYIDGLQDVSWGCGKRLNSSFGAMWANFKALGADISYGYLMGASSCAFRLQVSQPTWCPSSPHAFLGFNCIDRIFYAIPYKFESLGPIKPDDEAAMAKLWAEIVKRIDRGIPVTYAEEENSLLVGYEDSGAKFLYREYCADKPGYKTLDAWPFAFDVLVADPKEMPSKKQVAVRALEHALVMAKADRAPNSEGDGYYATGLNAFELWIKGLRDFEAVEALEGDAASANMLGSAHTYYCLIDARAAAAVFLKEMAPAFEGKARKHLEKAAALYDEMVSKVLAPDSTEIAPMPWWLKEGEKWTRETRERQAKVLEKALKLERKALKEIEAALAAG